MTTQQQDRLRAGSTSFAKSATYTVAKYTTIGALATKNITIGLYNGISAGIAEQARQRRLAQEAADAAQPLQLPIRTNGIKDPNPIWDDRQPVQLTRAEIIEAINQLKSML